MRVGTFQDMPSLWSKVGYVGVLLKARLMDAVDLHSLLPAWNWPSPFCIQPRAVQAHMAL